MPSRRRPAARGLVVTRGALDRCYTVRQGDQYIATLSFRQLEALCAVRKGSARSVVRTRRASYFDDMYLDTECDAFGIGRGTLGDLQDRRFIAKQAAPGPLELTVDGDVVLDAVLQFVAAERRTATRARQETAHA